MANVELFTMCMVRDNENGRVLVQDKAGLDGWEGITLPCCHVENGESLTVATRRMLRDEAGLEVRGLKLKGVVDWYNDVNHERWFMFLFETTQFEGEVRPSDYEEAVRWLEEEELDSIRLVEGMEDYLKIYRDDAYTEGFGIWNDIMIGGMKLQ